MLIKGDVGQRGWASPFMFGLLMGMTVFSALSLVWAKQELARVAERRAKQAQQQAEDTVKGLEFAALTETHATYSTDYTTARAKQFMANNTGRTRGGESILATGREVDGETFGQKGERVAITASDDTLERSKIYRTGDAREMLAMAASNTSVAVFDSNAVRMRQMMTSQKSMEGLAEQVFAFYAGHSRFPNQGEFVDLRARFPYTDAWGGNFDYTYVSNEEVGLAFTTPWNYTQTLKLDFKQQENPSDDTVPSSE